MALIPQTSVTGAGPKGQNVQAKQVIILVHVVKYFHEHHSLISIDSLL